MKNSFTIFYCLITSILIYSCGQSTKLENQTLAEETFQYNGQTYALKKSVTATDIEKPKVSKSSKVIFHEVHDTQRNMLLGYMPLPKSWKIHSKMNQENVIISGPNDIQVFAPKGNYYTYSELPGMNQMSAQAGQQVKPLMSVENLVKNELTPMMKGLGARLIKQYHLPQLQKYAENYDQFTFKSVPMQNSFKAYATEWENDEGSKLLFIINYKVSYSETGVYWGYHTDMLGAPDTIYEEAKNNYIYALTNRKYNPQWLQTCYMEEAQKAAQSGKLHQQRMAALRAEGHAIIERGKAHSAMVDNNHQKFMDAHLERTNVSSSGQSYQVESGSKEYWMNSSNEYISSDDLFYDPNTDNSVNNETWTKATIQN